jgi:hypothetical protein
MRTHEYLPVILPAQPREHLRNVANNGSVE